MSTQDEYRELLGEVSEQAAPLIVEVPAGLPTLHNRYRLGLNYSRYAVGVDANQDFSEPTGAVWQHWMILAIAIAFCAVFGTLAVLQGDGIIVLAVAPLIGLWLAGVVRDLRAEQKAERAKQARLAKRRRAMRD